MPRTKGDSLSAWFYGTLILCWLIPAIQANSSAYLMSCSMNFLVGISLFIGFLLSLFSVYLKSRNPLDRRVSRWAIIIPSIMVGFWAGFLRSSDTIGVITMLLTMGMLGLLDMWIWPNPKPKNNEST